MDCPITRIPDMYINQIPLCIEGWAYRKRLDMFQIWLLFFFSPFFRSFCFFPLFIELFWRSMEQLWFHHCSRQFNWYHNGRTQCKCVFHLFFLLSFPFSFFFFFLFLFCVRSRTISAIRGMCLTSSLCWEVL
jgi:hypothetical protein